MKNNTRYTSLQSRSFDQFIRIKIYDEILFKKQQQIDMTCFQKNAEKEFSALYQDMKKLREINKEIRAYISENKILIKEYKKSFYKYFEDNIFPYKVFCNVWRADDNKVRACEYCGITEAQIESLINTGRITTKRLYSRGRTLEIDRRVPDGPYSAENIILSCYWCNNAKTDEFSVEEFKYISKAIGDIWAKRLSDIGL